MKCECGCGEEVKEGNRFIRGHNSSFYEKKHTVETKKKISEAGKGRSCSEETRRKLSEALTGRIFTEEHRRNISEAQEGRIHSEKTKEKISEAMKGNKNRFSHGGAFVLSKHHKFRKQECIFGCDSMFYELHHEPPIKELLNWEGRLVNLCVSCHQKIHHNSLELPEDVGTEWTVKQTKEVLIGDVI